MAAAAAGRGTGAAGAKRVLASRIVFTPDGSGYTFCAPTRFDKLFSGFAGTTTVKGKAPAWLSEVLDGYDDSTEQPIPDEGTPFADYNEIWSERHRLGDSNRSAVASPPGQTDTYLDLPLGGDIQRAA